MPTIMIAHIANVRRTSAAVHGLSVVIPIAAILFAYSIDEDIWRSRWIRYAQASAVMITMQVEMRTRSRRGRAAADDRLGTPGKRRVLSVVLAANIVPRQTEGVDVALRGVGKGEAVRSRVTRVFQIEWLSGVRVDSLGALSRHVDEARRSDGPLDSVATKLNWRRFHAQKLSDQAGQSGHRSACGPAGDRHDGFALLNAGPFVGNKANRPVSFSHRLRRPSQNDERGRQEALCRSFLDRP